VMSQDGSHMAIVKRLAMANHTHTWWDNRGSLNINCSSSGGSPVNVNIGTPSHVPVRNVPIQNGPIAWPPVLQIAQVVQTCISRPTTEQLCQFVDEILSFTAYGQSHSRHSQGQIQAGCRGRSSIAGSTLQACGTER